MARIDFRSQRVFVETALLAGAEVPLDRAQSNYLLNVLRFSAGDAVLLFNGRDGEWRATLQPAGRKAASLLVGEQTRAQPAPSPLTYAFAPLKQARLDYMAQKAVEMGAGVLQPVLTQHTQVPRVPTERLHSNAVEAAEQCGILAVPAVREPIRFAAFLADWPAGAPLVFCDEDAEDDPLPVLQKLRDAPSLGVLIGPEGGFSVEERAALLARTGVLRISLGPRILRADTAAVAALALVQAVRGA